MEQLLTLTHCIVDIIMWRQIAVINYYYWAVQAMLGGKPNENGVE